MIFQHVTPEDAGIYTCVASTSSGKISCSAELTVEGMIHEILREPEAPAIKLSLSDVEVMEGASAVLEAKITGFPKPKVTWYRETEIIESSERHKFLYEDFESYALMIKNVKKEEAGKYHIKAVNELGQAETSGKLIVNSPPKFKKQLRDQSIMTDETLKIDVEIQASPEPDVKWYKDGRQLKEGERIKYKHESGEIYQLLVEKVNTEDSGTYSCIATNELGQQSSSSAVTVNCELFIYLFVNKLK